MSRIPSSIAPIAVIPVAAGLIRNVWDEAQTVPETYVTTIVSEAVAKTVTTAAKSVAGAKAVTKAMSTPTKAMSAAMTSMRTSQRGTRWHGKRGENDYCESQGFFLYVHWSLQCS